jgi:hypothetical protein
VTDREFVVTEDEDARWRAVFILGEDGAPRFAQTGYALADRVGWSAQSSQFCLRAQKSQESGAHTFGDLAYLCKTENLLYISGLPNIGDSP